MADLTEDVRTLPLDVLLRLVDADPLAAASTLARDVPSEVITAVLERWPNDEGLVEVARGHWNAPVHVKFTLPLWQVSAASMEHFLDSVEANDEERTAVWALYDPAHERHTRNEPIETLGATWARIRPLNLA